jgi:hypothetical protein
VVTAEQPSLFVFGSFFEPGHSLVQVEELDKAAAADDDEDVYHSRPHLAELVTDSVHEPAGRLLGIGLGCGCLCCCSLCFRESDAGDFDVKGEGFEGNGKVGAALLFTAVWLIGYGKALFLEQPISGL